MCSKSQYGIENGSGTKIDNLLVGGGIIYNINIQIGQLEQWAVLKLYIQKVKKNVKIENFEMVDVTS